MVKVKGKHDTLNPGEASKTHVAQRRQRAGRLEGGGGGSHWKSITAKEPDFGMMNALAEILRRQRHYDRALSMYEECLAKMKRVIGTKTTPTQKTLKF